MAKGVSPRNNRSSVLFSKSNSLAPLYWGVIATTVLAAAVALGTVWLGGRAQNEDHWIRHTLAVRSQLQMIHSLVLQTESAQRGYLLTSRQNYLSRYQPSVTALRAALNRITALTGDNPQQVAALSVLRRDVADKLDEMQQTIGEYDAGQHDAALALVDSDRGQRATAAIRNQIDAMAATEEALLVQRETAARSLVFLLQVGSVAAFFLICGIGVLVAYFARRSLSAIQKANAQLSVANRNLLEQISRREAIESQLRQAQKMEAIGQLTGGIAHDFNNMLGVVTGALDLMRRRMKNDAFGIARYIDAAAAATERSAALTQRLLAFARQQPLSPAPVDANRMIANMSELLRSTLGEHIQIETVLTAGLWKTSADPSQLESAIINVAINARDAMADGGRLTLRTSNIAARDCARFQAKGMPAADYVLVEVTDTGTGIAPAIVGKIFEPFFSTKEIGKGTGLGLSTVYGIIKQTGGFIYVDSLERKGTTFRIFLPRLAAGAQAAAAAEPEVQRLTDVEAPAIADALAAASEVKRAASADLTGEGTILLVEDEEGLRALNARGLASRGYTVLEAGNGVEAIDVLEKSGRPVDLVVSDVVMPEMDGPTLARELRKRNPALKIIFVSGYAQDAFQHLPDPGEYEFLPKPFTLKQLVAAVKETLAA